jgi:hypothetical protein
MEYICTICEKEYKTYQSLWNHNDRYHKNNSDKISTKYTKNPQNNICPFCDKILFNHKSRWRHEKICKVKKEYESKNKKSDERIKMLEKEIEKLKSGNKKIITNNNSNTTNNNNNGTINNNVQIIINKIGTENINDLNEAEVKEIFANNMESLVKFIQHMNFNSRLPSNHNFCTTSLDGQYLNIYNTDKSEQQKERKKYFFEDLLSRSIGRMELLYTKYKNNFSKKKQQKIEEDITTLKIIRDRDMNDNLLREMLKKLNLLSYNYKETVLKTWNNPDIIGNEKTFEEDLDADDSDIKDIEDIFIKPDCDDTDYDTSDDDISSEIKKKLDIKPKNKKSIEL